MKEKFIKALKAHLDDTKIDEKVKRGIVTLLEPVSDKEILELLAIAYTTSVLLTIKEDCKCTHTIIK